MDYTIIDKLTQMQNFIGLAMTDAEKFDNGNNAAGTRVRKYMQDVKKLAQSIRAQVSDIKNGVEDND